MPNNIEEKRHGKMEITNARVAFLSKELLNGGRGLTFDELSDVVHEAHPAGFQMSSNLIKRVVYGVQNDIVPQTRDEATKIQLPTGYGMPRWLEEREAARVRFVRQQEARKRWNKKQKKAKSTRPKSGHKNQTQRALEAVETAPENIRAVLSELPDDVNACLDKLKELMQKHHYLEVVSTMQEDGKLHSTVKPEPHPIYTKR